MNPNDEKALIKRMDAVLNVLLASQRKNDKMTAQEQILALDSVGLRDAEIANILGRTRGYIASVLSVSRKQGGANE